MDIDIEIKKFTTEIKPVVRNDEIKAFVIWRFETNMGLLKITGGTIRLKPFGKYDKPILTFEGPAVRTRSGFIKVFFFDNKDFYKKLCEQTVEDYCKETGELPNKTVFSEEINVDEIPL